MVDEASDEAWELLGEKSEMQTTTNEQTPDLGLSPCDRELNYHTRVADSMGLRGLHLQRDWR